jgi:hypothetical protein
VTIAERIAAGKLKAPAVVEAAQAQVLAVAAGAHAGIVEAHRRAVAGLVPAHRPEEAAWADKGLRDDHLANSTYAYRFEDFEDGSRLAVFVARHGDEVQLLAFPSGWEANWHPVRNPAG